MYEKFKMRNMTWQEFAKKKDDVIILPIGATEQHGPHLPTCVDAVLAEEFAYRIAEKINGVVAPTLSYGYKSKPLSGGGPLFPGTIDLNGATLQALVMDIIDEFVRDGFTKIFILSAHFENEAFIIEAMDLCSAKYGDKVKLLLTNWWDPMSPDVIDKVFDEVEFPGWALEHAAVTETSLMMYFAPELVREDKILDTENANPATYFRYPIEKDIVPETGILHQLNHLQLKEEK
ncbi:creatinine amidohydrolase family protein [[Clostridium] sordellii ATCC 9714]|nr:creatinine amidohydrolase family protein [[Clostridium] sordellii ATCC 9714] [Paeniclostridium sordellii ATCC 9714]